MTEPQKVACPDPAISASLARIEAALGHGSERMDRMAKATEDLTAHVQLTNGRVGELEVAQAVRAGVEQSNAKMFASVIAGGAVLISATIGVLQLTGV